jgi:4-amino-4-deoxy-L-arabinose transferase-like glycosyltransferase
MDKKNLLLAAILLLAIVLRFTNLARIPNGFIPEEVSTGWNAYSLLKTGRDEWGTRLPIIFRETGGYKLALNSYLIVPVMAILGPTELAVRIPTAFAGVLAVYLTYVLTIKLWKKETYALAAALLLAVNPWHIAMGRYAVDVNWGIPLFLAGLIFFLKATTHKRAFWLAAICFGLTYYTYFNYVVFTFLFLIGLFAVNWRYWLQRRLLVVGFFVIQFLFLSPYIIQPNLTTRFSQATSVGAIGLTNQTNEHRGACITTYPAVICKVFYNKITARSLEIARNYINHYSTTTLFLYGSKLGLSGMPDGWGYFYLFEFPLIILGIIWMIRQRLFVPLLVFWLFLYGLPSALAGEHHIWRMMTLLPVPQLIGGVGLVALTKLVRSKIAWVGAGIVIAIFVQRYIADYFGYFPYAQAANAYYGFRDVYHYTETIADKYPYIVVAPTGLGFDQLYIYYLFYTRHDPASFASGHDVERVVGGEQWVHVNRIGKWHFESDVRNSIFSLPDKTLFIADGTFNENAPLPKKVMRAKLLKTISYPNGDAAFKIIELTKNPEYVPAE